MNNTLVKKIIINWLLPIVLSLFIAFIIRTLFIESFIINDSNMSPELNKGDLVVVNKFGKIRRNNIIAFYHPQQKKETNVNQIYLKRCVALPGDTLLIENKRLLVNNIHYPDSNYLYDFRILAFDSLSLKQLKDKYHIIKDFPENPELNLTLNLMQFVQLKEDSLIQNISMKFIDKGLNNPEIYPNSYLYRWNKDQFGPLIIPHKGMKIKLNRKNFTLYKQLIIKHEQAPIEYKNEAFYYHNKLISDYTFKQNYYFVLNDYRDNPEDSRKWGLIPQNYLIGKVRKRLFSF